MTEKDVRSRLEALQKDREHLKYQLAGYDGAIQDCEYWLGVVIAEAKETPSQPLDVEVTA